MVVSPSPQFWMPPESPPPRSAWLPETVDRSTTIVPPAFESPPPEQAEPPVTVTSLSVRVPALRTFPPKQPFPVFAEPPLSVTAWMITGVAEAVTSKTRLPAGPRIAVWRAPAPVIVIPLLTTSAPKPPASW